MQEDKKENGTRKKLEKNYTVDGVAIGGREEEWNRKNEVTCIGLPSI